MLEFSITIATVLFIFTYAAVGCFTAGLMTRFAREGGWWFFGMIWPVTWIVSAIAGLLYCLYWCCEWVYKKAAGEIWL